MSARAVSLCTSEVHKSQEDWRTLCVGPKHSEQSATVSKLIMSCIMHSLHPLELFQRCIYMYHPGMFTS